MRDKNPKNTKKNVKLNKMSRTALKKKARELAKIGQLGSKYHDSILALLEGRPLGPIK